MKISAQEEYGLRILLRIARNKSPEGLSIPHLSEAEGLSVHNVAKLARILRLEGYINSTPGHVGGYVLAMPADTIKINKVLRSLGGALFPENFCGSHCGVLELCTNTIDCSIRSLWKMIQNSIDQVLERVTLHDLAGSEKEFSCILENVLLENAKDIKQKK